MRFVHAFATFINAYEQIQIPLRRPTNPTKEVRAIIAKLPPEQEKESLIEMNWGEEDVSPNERFLVGIVSTYWR